MVREEELSRDSVTQQGHCNSIGPLTHGTTKCYDTSARPERTFRPSSVPLSPYSRADLEPSCYNTPDPKCSGAINLYRSAIINRIRHNVCTQRQRHRSIVIKSDLTIKQIGHKTSAQYIGTGMYIY